MFPNEKSNDDNDTSMISNGTSLEEDIKIKSIHILYDVLGTIDLLSGTTIFVSDLDLIIM